MTGEREGEASMLFRLLSGVKTQEKIKITELGLRGVTKTGRVEGGGEMSAITSIDVWNPRRPFSETSAKLLYRALKDVEEALNDMNLSTPRVFQQLPVRAMEARMKEGDVNDLMLRTELNLKTAMRWLMTRNKMITVDDPQGVDMHDPDLAVEMIVESTKVIDQVTELAEKWKELATKPFEVDERTIQWVVQVTTAKTELRLLISMFVAAESIRRGDRDPLSWIV